jgi:AcrR family transcriptional regulator
VDEAEAKRMRRLPPGPHGLPPELVERNQRERLVAAMAEVCGERGYAESSVAEIARRAGVSTASFYRQFKDRRECMLVSFKELFGRLLEEIERGCAAEADPSAKARAGTRTAADLLASDLPTARLLSIEILAVGPEGVRLQHEAIDRLATRLRLGAEEPSTGTSPDPAWAAAASTLALVAKRTAAGESPDPTELEALVALP